MNEADKALHDELVAILGGEAGLKRVAENARRDMRFTRKEARLIKRVNKLREKWESDWSVVDYRRLLWAERRLWALREKAR